MPELLLPLDGHLVRRNIQRACAYKRPLAALQSRIAYSAAHVVADPFREQNPQTSCAIDWESTMAYRHAEAMDTAQRGMGLSWPAALELIANAMTEAKPWEGLVACGAGTDHLPEGLRRTMRLRRETRCAGDPAGESRSRSHRNFGVRMYTGDDFNYEELIAGDGAHHSDTDGIPPVASACTQALDAGKTDGFRRILDLAGVGC